MNGHTASAPSSASHSPSTRVNGTASRTVKSQHVSPTRPGAKLSNASAAAATSTSRYSPQPPIGRNMSIGGGGGGSESKSASAHNSPNLPTHTLASGVTDSALLWPNGTTSYEKTLQDVYHMNAAHHTIGQHQAKPAPSNQYDYVVSSGYGRRR